MAFLLCVYGCAWLFSSDPNKLLDNADIYGKLDLFVLACSLLEMSPCLQYKECLNHSALHSLPYDKTSGLVKIESICRRQNTCDSKIDIY